MPNAMPHGTRRLRLKRQTSRIYVQRRRLRGIAANTLKPEQIDYLQQHVRMLSGLYGVLRPLDLMQPYRLEMGTAFANTRGKNLYEFWGDKLPTCSTKR